MRTPGRLTVWVTLGLAVLAAGAVSRFTDLLWPLARRVRARRDARRPARPVRPRRPVPPARPLRAAGAARSTGATRRPPAPARSRPALPRAAAGLLRPRAAVPERLPWQHRAARSLAAARIGGEPAPGARGLRAWRPRAVAFFAAPLLVLPAAGAVVEGVPSETFPHSQVEPIGLDLKRLPEPILILPTIGVWDYYTQVWSTDGFPTLVNGSSGFDPKEQQRMREVLRPFPDTDSVAYLRARQVKVVVMLRKLIPNSPWQGSSYRGVEGLGIAKEDHGDYVLYFLGGPAG
jgi:hypothetical protein